MLWTLKTGLQHSQHGLDLHHRSFVERPAGCSQGPPGRFGVKPETAKKIACLDFRRAAFLAVTCFPSKATRA
jgi:hypothetical protein